jgi:hypothetical protein
MYVCDNTIKMHSHRNIHLYHHYNNDISEKNIFFIHFFAQLQACMTHFCHPHYGMPP